MTDQYARYTVFFYSWLWLTIKTVHTQIYLNQKTQISTFLIFKENAKN